MRSEGRPIVVDTRKAIALLFYLTVEKSASRNALAGLFWANSPQERARATLRRTLSALRSAAPGIIEADRDRVTLGGEVTSDLHVLTTELEATSTHGHDPHDVCPRCLPHLRRATDLYRGDFLGGFSIKASPEFEDWVRGVAESLRIKVADAYLRMETGLAADGDYPGAIAAVARWIELDPLHEPAYRNLMLLHAWAGDGPGAVDAYRSCVTVLENELGVPPLAETTELLEAILDGDLPPAPGLRRRVKADVSLVETRRENAIIGRQRELQTLQAEALDASGTVVALRGAPWMGKTRLLEELGALAESDRVVLVGRAHRTEKPIPYGVVAQILRGVVRAADAASEELPEWASLEVGRVLPELSTTSGPAPGDTFGELRFLEAVHVFVAALAATRPVILLIDDAQWIDNASAEALQYLARRISGEPISLVVTARTGDPLPDSAVEVLSAADRLVDIEPLRVDEIVPLVGERRRAEEIQDRTGGLPILVAEAVKSESTDQDTPGMHRYMESRLSEVSELALQVLAAASVLGGLCDSGLLRETSGRSEEEVVQTVEELVGAGLLREIPETDGLGFTLDALERLTYESLSAVRRRLLHRRAARALASRGSAATDVRLASSIAAQYTEAYDPAAADWYRIAADLAREAYANEMAGDFYEKAIALGYPDPQPLRLALGEVAIASGDYQGARRQLTLAGDMVDGGLTGVVEYRKGQVERLLGHFERAAGHFQLALGSHPTPAMVLADWALLAHRIGNSEQALSLASEARSAADEDDTGVLSRVHNIQAVVATDHDDAMKHSNTALELAGSDNPLRMAALNTRAQLLARDGSFDEAIGMIVEAIEIARTTGHRHREAALWNHLADLHHGAGRQDQSRQALTQAVSLFADVASGDLEPEIWLLSTW